MLIPKYIQGDPVSLMQARTDVVYAQILNASDSLLTLGTLSRVINKNIRTEIFMRSCEKICELILTPRPARLTSEQA